ncbi:uncharacterized protein ARMOST_13815 [Armillaria ostoyae]|uniref:HNH nuclease domain-containing protein n=1 Tax=Armillaria ostoyae TaxID=47428 RepID=A0A284RNT5_ARMOS|nr:uncharacterized protein ARMOST_13815 [Armillaria ostoyae]
MSQPNEDEDCKCCLQIFIWWQGTDLHKKQIFSIPLGKFVAHTPVALQNDSLYPPTQNYLQLKAIMAIARASLGGFFIPADITNAPRSADDGIYRFSFHCNDPTTQMPGDELSSDELLQPLAEVANTAGEKIFWIRSSGDKLPTNNALPINLAEMKESDIGKRSKNVRPIPRDTDIVTKVLFIQFARCVKRKYPKEQKCPFTRCIGPEACHIVECHHGNKPCELIIELTNAVRDNAKSCYPRANITPRRRPQGFLDLGFPARVVDLNSDEWKKRLKLKDIVDMPANGMMLESNFHRGYDRFRWCFYMDTIFWIPAEGCPQFDAHGWIPKMIFDRIDLPHLVGRLPGKIRQDPDRAVFQSIWTIFCFMHRFGVFEFRKVLSELLTNREDEEGEGEEQHEQQDKDTDGKKMRGRGGRGGDRGKRDSNDHDGDFSKKGRSGENDDISARTIPGSSGSHGSGVTTPILTASSLTGRMAAAASATVATAEASLATLVGSGTLEDTGKGKEPIQIVLEEISVPRPKEVASSAIRYQPAFHTEVGLGDSDDSDEEEEQEQAEQRKETERLMLLWILNC